LLLRGFYAISAGLVVLAIMQIFVIHLEPLIALYGLRNYCFYIPLAFIIAQQFRPGDLVRLVRHTLIVSIPIALLVFVQSRSPASSFINRGLVEGGRVFMVAGDLVRTTGTFTFSAGQTLFVSSVIFMLLALWLQPAQTRPMKLPLLIVCAGAVLTNLAVSGSRAAYFFAAFAFAAAVVFAMVTRKRTARIKALVVLPLMLIMALGLYTTVFHSSYQAMNERASKAETSEGSPLQRVWHIVGAVVQTLPSLTVLGHGLGAGTTGAVAALSQNSPNFEYAENEGARVLQEAGLLGVLYMTMRWILAASFLRYAIVATRSSGQPLPLLLSCYAAVVMSFAQVTLQGTTNAYGWLFAGFCMSANRLAIEKKAQAIKGTPSTRVLGY
jgi:O-antigen ligase